jgi:hypothetical protein
MQPNVDNWKKLTRGVQYLCRSKELYLTLEAEDGIDIKWLVDASFAVHPDMRSHTGTTVLLGKGSVYSLSRKQCLNTKSSTEAELVGVDDSMPLVIWTQNFILGQGYEISDNVVFQDNQSTMLLEKNGKEASSGHRTRHIDIRYFFVTDRIKNGEMRIEHCPMEEMVADFFTKPLQGSLFQKLRGLILYTPVRPPSTSAAASQECVENVRKVSYTDVVRGTSTHPESTTVDDAMNWHVVKSRKNRQRNERLSTSHSLK